MLTLRAFQPDVHLAVNAFALTTAPGYRAEMWRPPVTLALLPAGSTAPDWTLRDPRGKTHSLAKLRGKVVVLDFWASWCGPCLTLMPKMQALHERFTGRGVEVFGVNCWDEADPAAYFKRKGYDFGLLLVGEEITDAYRVGKLPAYYVIGVDGKVVYSGHASDGNESLSRQVEAYLLRLGR